MKRLAILVVLLAASAAAQQPPLNSPLLDHLAGRWVLQGMLAGKQTTHDLTADWVLDHHYLRLHEVAREKKADGKPQYEATLHIAWNENTKTYAIVWLDVYGGAAAESIGVASAKENELPFIFKDEKGAINFSNDFVYDPKTDSWQWIMDNIVNGQHKPFGRVTLTRPGSAPQVSSQK